MPRRTRLLIPPPSTPDTTAAVFYPSEHSFRTCSASTPDFTSLKASSRSAIESRKMLSQSRHRPRHQCGDRISSSCSKTCESWTWEKPSTSHSRSNLAARVGKSSLLEALCCVLFPISGKVCTRFGTEVSLRRAPELSVPVWGFSAIAAGNPISGKYATADRPSFLEGFQFVRDQLIGSEHEDQAKGAMEDAFAVY